MREVQQNAATTDLFIIGAGFEVNKRLMTGLEAISVVLTLPSGVSESLRCTLAKDMTRYVANIRWLHPGVHHIAVLINGIRVPQTPIRVMAEGREISLSACVVSGEGATKSSPANRPSFDSTREITVVTQFISARWRRFTSKRVPQRKSHRRFRREQSRWHV